jgi:hypothetical protein
MPIKFKCPHCQKPLSVKEHLAGKRAACPACKKVLTIPVPTAPPVDLEEFAASAFADEPAAQQPAEQPATIDFICPFCDEELHLSPDQGGKQAPCPACRRIIKVPLPAVKQPTQDWRQLEARGPSLAKREEEVAPEGAWGTAARPGTVSQEALEEADAFEEEREPLTRAQKIRRIVYVAAGVGVLFLGFLYLKSYWAKSLQEKAVSQALAYVEGKESRQKIVPEGAAEVYLALGELDLRANKGQDARSKFRNARARLQAGSAVPVEHDAVLRELAVAQVGLGGSKQQVEDKARLTWDDASKEWSQTLRVLGAPEARVAAARSVCRELIARDQWDLAAGVVALLSSSLPAPGPAKDKKAKPAGVSPRPVALLLALHRPEAATKVVPAPAKKQAPDLATQLIHTKKWPSQPQLQYARQFFVEAEAPVPQRLECLLTVAEAALGKDQPDEARTCVDAAVGLLRTLPKEEPPSPWLLLSWADLACRTGQTGPWETFTRAITDPALQAWAQLAQYRSKIKEEEPAEDSWKQAVPDTKSLSHGLALLSYARQQARQGKGSEFLNSVAEMEPESLRPLGYVGVALGVQDREK